MSNSKLLLKLMCPSCNKTIKAVVEEGLFKGFVLFSCPKCSSNVVCYENKVNVISNNMVKRLMKSRRLKSCGSIDVCPETPIKETEIKKLKETLDKCETIEDFLSEM